jgi:hypothetical protein
LTLDSSGNLGVGTTSPNSKLEVTSTGASVTAALALANYQGGGDGTGSKISFRGQRGAPNAQVEYGYIQTAMYDWTGTPYMNMSIMGGNLGLGTASPGLGGARTYSKVLTIDGGVSASLENTGAAELGGSTDVNDRLVGSLAFFNRDNTGSTGATRQQVGLIETICVTSNSNVNNDSGGTLVFLTKAEAGFVTEKMRLDSSGNLGLGVTPSAWDSGAYKAIQLGTGIGIGGVIARVDNTNQFNLGLNWRYDGGAAREYIASSFATNYEQASGAHAWYTAPTGTAGDNISFTQAMTLDSSGNLGIGTSSPTRKLDVATAGVSYIRASNTTNSVNVDMYAATAVGGFGTQSNHPLDFFTNNTDRARIDTSGNLLVGATAVGNGGKLYVNGSISLGTSTTGAQSSMAKDTTQLTTSISTSATTIYTDISSGMSSASAGYFIIYGSNNAGAGFMDVVIAKASGTPVVVSSSTIEGSPAARTYSVSSFALRLTMASGTYNVNLKATVLGYPF